MTRITSAAAGNVAFLTSAGTGLFFPIGTPGAYRPITLALEQTTATATTYTAQVNPGPAPAQLFPASSPGSIKRVSNVRHYPISTNGASSFTKGRITIYYGIDDQVDAPSKLRVAKSQASGIWANLGTAGTVPADGTTFISSDITSGTSQNASTAPDAPFTTLGNFTLASTEATSTAGNNPLPVALARFAAALAPTGVNVTWATATEQNNDRFEVQRSADGQAFQTIGTVKGSGNSSSLREYAFVDGRPFAGVSYYRLRQVDTDGTSAFSPVAAVQARTAAAVYPNPTADGVRLPATLGPVRYRVLNAVGQTLLSGQAAGNDRLDLTTLRKGVYFLELTDAAGRTTQRLVRE